ncbi:MAG: iron ABC transporter ATP-binding protein [Candidatus Sericytochromatia bacterium]|nr:MAG: iron ABC transporter ATP-binding protein [Candidatus Sericytochromatia bacterium]
MSLKVSNLSYLNILKNIKFSINKSEFVSIIGPNGAGKSTLLKIISSILDNYQGVVYIDNQNIKDINIKNLSKIRTFVPAENNFENKILVFDYISFGRYPYQNFFGNLSKKDIKIIEEVANLCNVSKFLNKNINDLSSGEKQRVILAKALAQEPKILLLDEPISHLDINYQSEIISLIKDISKNNKITIITILHDINIASYFSDKIILINNGQIVDFGHPNDVINYKNINNVFGDKWDIFYNNLNNRPYIVPKKYKYLDLKNKKIHIICGGGSAIDIINLLSNSNAKVSLGVLNIGDSDYIIAKKNNLEIIEEEPFSYIKDENIIKLRQKLNEVNYIYLSNVPFGKGNLANLQELFFAYKNGKHVIMDKSNLKERDFTNGLALELLNQIEPKYNSIDEFISKFN